MRKKILFSLIIVVVSFCLIIILINGSKEGTYLGSKDSVIEGENGWFYYFLINYSDKKNEYIFDGYNLKYEEKDGYNIWLYDSKKVGDEGIAITDFFNKKQFINEISIDDLKGLSLDHFEKSFLVELFNKTVKSEVNNEITKLDIHTYEFFSDEEKDGYKINIGIRAQRKGIVSFRIDLKYSNGTYLSELVENNRATKKQVEIYNNLLKISSDFIESQDLNIREKYDFKDEIYNRVFLIIESIKKYE